jgi:hypothetical protein
MRHGRHYVEQLMGEAPLRTVREIAIADIEAPPESPADLRALEASIREHGVLEPLLVTPRNGRYQLIAGRDASASPPPWGCERFPVSSTRLRMTSWRSCAMQPGRERGRSRPPRRNRLTARVQRR